MNTNFKENKLKITYEVPLEDINKKLKDDIISTLKGYWTLWNIFKNLFVAIMVGLLLGAALNVAIVIASTVVSACSGSEPLSENCSSLLLLISTALSIVVFLVAYIYTIISEVILIKKLVHISNTASHEEFFEEYAKEQYHFLMFDYDDLIHYKEFKSIIKHIDSLVKIEACKSSLWITSTAENGDIETTFVDIDKIIQNINVKEPEIRIGYGYKITYLEPYKIL